MRRAIALAIASFSLSFAALAAPPSQQFKLGLPGAGATLDVPRFDAAKALAEDATAPEHVPLRYAIASRHAVDPHGDGGKASTGAWETLPDGRVAWRLVVRSPGALSLDFGFDRMFLPRGAELYVSSLDGKLVRGPYTEADHTPFGGFWTPYVPGDVALIEAVMPAAMQPHFDLELTTVHSAYRDLEGDDASLAKAAGSCNVDVACPAASPYRDQQRAVARYTFSGSICTGQLVNNTARDGKRYFISANHCASTQSEVNSLVAYWKYESATCRTPRTAPNAVPLPVTGNSIPQTGGATLRMTFEAPDTTLLELNTEIPAAADPFFDGWDRRDVPPTSGVVIHHPRGEEKRIAIENNPLQLSDAGRSGVPGTRHFRVVDYDLGTTEPGSSGSGLLNPDKRLIGVLSGGAAACASSPSQDADNDGDNDGDDYFGRLPVAWEGGGTPATRLRDWLDPANTGVQVLDGAGGCDAPTAVLNGPATIAAGVPAEFSLNVTGQSPFTVAWDIDGDGVTDRTSLSSNTGAAIAPVFPGAQTATVVARITDAANCSTQVQRALVVTAPSVAAASAGAPVQVCGDGDTAIEPGERFRIPVRLTNEGAQAMQSGFAVFARAQGAAAGASYVQADSTAGATCPFQFVDISTAAPLPLTASDEGFPATDDGRTGVLPLPGGPIEFFGETVTSLVMSTNGYLSTATTESGGDYDNACPVDTPDRGSSGGRLNVLHDDLAVLAGGGLRTQYFATCPRPANSGSAPRGCTVFQWNSLARVTGDGSGREGDFTMQAIVYDGTNQVVYQYRSADPLGGGSATIGVQNAGNTVRSQYACNETNRIAAGRAVCFFHPAALPGALDPARIRLVTPAVALGDLGAGQQATVDAQIEVDPTAQCGAPLTLDYVGAVDDVAHTLRGTRVLDTTVGGGGACQTFTGTCPTVAQFAKKDGLYSSLVRFGNGMGAFNIPTPSGTIFGGQWYTGRRDRTPEWLILQGPIVDNQADVPVFRFRQTGTNPFAVASTIVGRAQISYTSSTDYIATWTVDGVAAGEKLTLLYGTNRPSPNRTGSWFPPSESGWGLAIDDHFLPNGQAEQVIVNYFYDAAGNPVWTLGGGPVGGGTQPHNVFRVHCPSCPSLPDMLNDIRPAGTVTANYTGLTTGTYSTVITFPPPLSGSWFRNNLPIQMISPPQTPASESDTAGTSGPPGGGTATPPPATRPRAGVHRLPPTRSRTREVIR